MLPYFFRKVKDVNYERERVLTEDNDFLDLVDGNGNVFVQGKGVSGVNAKARAEGLKFPALGYWSPEGHCFITPAPGDCNGVFKK